MSSPTIFPEPTRGTRVGSPHWTVRRDALDGAGSPRLVRVGERQGEPVARRFHRAAIGAGTPITAARSLPMNCVPDRRRTHRGQARMPRTTVPP